VRYKSGIWVAGFLLTTLFAGVALAYEYPLSSAAIREAYFLGTGPDRAGADFLAAYSHTVPELRVGSYVTVVRLETPYSHIVEHVRGLLNYSAQDAVRDFQGKPATLRIVLDVAYITPDVTPNASGELRITVSQNKKEISPKSVHTSSYYPFQDAFQSAPRIGEHVHLDFKPAMLDSSTLTVAIDTPDGRHAETEFDLAALK
jgi:hypothetical protein